jgi:phytol kinase
MSATGVLPVVPGVLLALAAYGLLFGAAELLRRRRSVGAETTRRLVHVLGTVVALPLPVVLGVPVGVVLAIVLAAALAWSRRHATLESVHGVERATVGEVVFPLGIALAAVVAQDYAQYCLGVLVLGLADATAGWVGGRIGRPVRGWPAGKSLAGSTAFLLMTIALAAGFFIAQGDDRALLLAPSALAVTLVEALLTRGWDNLAVPSATALAFAWMF